MSHKLTFNVGFTHRGELSGNVFEDETQFDIEIGTFADMMTELTQLFNDFCDENKFVNPRIVYIEKGEES